MRIRIWQFFFNADPNQTVIGILDSCWLKTEENKKKMIDEKNMKELLNVGGDSTACSIC